MAKKTTKKKSKKKATKTPERAAAQELNDLAFRFLVNAATMGRVNPSRAEAFKSAAATIKAVAEHLEVHGL